MKRLVVFILLACALNPAFPQNPGKIPYYDALALSKYLENGSFSRDKDAVKDTIESIAAILVQYLNGHENLNVNKLKGNEVLSEFKQKQSPNYNPFLAPLINTSAFASNDFTKNISSRLGNLPAAIGGLDVTSIADGFAKFLVKRTKEELNVAFFSKFKETLEDHQYADLKTLFPKTWELLEAIGDEIYDYNKYLQNLREAFQADIKTLDENLPGILSNHKVFFDRHFELTASLNSACYISRSLKNQMHPGDILDDYPMDYLRKEGQTEFFNRNWSGALQTLQLISESLRDSSGANDNYWVGSKKIKELINNKETFQIYLGLIYQVAKNERYRSIPFEKGSVVKLLDSAAADYKNVYMAYKSYISNFAYKANVLNEMLKNYSKPKNDSMAVENYTRYFNASVDFIEYCTMVCTLPHFKNAIGTDLHEELGTFFKITHETADLATDINRRNYASAINHTLAIYGLLRTKVLSGDLKVMEINAGIAGPPPAEQNRAVEKSKKAMARVITGLEQLPVNDTIKASIKSELQHARFVTAGTSPEIDAQKDSLKKSKEMLQKLMRYGTFMGTVATAKNSDDVERAIEAAALPSGSSRIKRETPFNVSLNAYTGLFVGYEKISGMKNDNFKINNYGVTAPIGVAISTGGHSFLCAWPKNEGHWSYSLFISLIDIGAVASFRFQNNDSVAQVPTIQLKDIFSPGLFFSLGFPKCPLSFNLGAQVGPNLRNVSVKDEKGNIVNKYQDNVYWRFSASLVVDIPVFNFYSKSKQ